MANSAQSAKANPVHVLRQHVTALEAAMELAAVKPRKKPVHALRTMSRRIEAELELICLMEAKQPLLAGVSDGAAKVKKLLAVVRKAAGAVRDLDVQRDLIRDGVEGEGAVQDETRIRKEAKYLRRALKEQRADEARVLAGELAGHARKLGPRLERLLGHLEAANDVRVTAAEAMKLIRGWYEEKSRGSGGSERALHGARKAAKLARYMAESVGADAAAEDFQNLQQVGGAWHDALTLRRTAHDHLGRRSPLVGVFAGQEEASLGEFRATLGLGIEA